jgi:DNA-binding GntR family transcriptional regulator
MALKRALPREPRQKLFRQATSRSFCPVAIGAGKLYTKLYVRLQTAGFCLNQARRRSRHVGGDQAAAGFSSSPMTVHRALRKKPAPRGATAPAKRRLRKVAVKRGARGPAIAELIATRLEEDIVLGRRHPRERLIEQDLCQQFNTHRADVRLAFFELEKKGIIQRIPNRGAMVRDLSPQEVMQIYAVREELEVMAARILPFPVARADIDKLDEIQRKYSAAIDSGDLLDVFYGNLHFHRTLYELCGNTCLIETIEQLAQKVYGIRSYANAYPDALDRARLDHLAMIGALRTSNRHELIALTRRHLEPSPEAYIRAYQRRFGDVSPAPRQS